MKKYKIIIAVTILLLLLNTVLLGLLWFGKKPQPPFQGPIEQLLKEKLSLTEDQVKQFRTLKEEHQKLNRAILDSMRPCKDALFALLGKEPAGSRSVDSLTGIIGNYEKRKDINTFEHFSKVRQILNPEQQKTFDGTINDILRTLGRQQHPPGDRPPFPPPGHDGPPPGHEQGPPPGQNPPQK